MSHQQGKMQQRMTYEIHNANCFEWLANQAPNSFQAVITDPPYGVIEFTSGEIEKMRSGVGGIWRIPMEIGGSKRRPQPRFTVLSLEQRQAVETYFADWASLLAPVLVPGAHVLVATNVLLSSRVQNGIERAGFEYRGQIIRMYRGMRGGDRPKLAENEFPDVAVSLRGGHEPWLLFRKPIELGMRVSDNLRIWGTGGLRRVQTDVPFVDVIQSERTPKAERLICDHPTMKPQSLMRPLTRLLLPLGEGRILDPFMGSGSTIAAAHAQGLSACGVELDPQFFSLAKSAIPHLAQIEPRFSERNSEVPLFAEKVR
ncbi:DNA methyltransferase [Deinococcus rubellus]|uniref:Methyltransferase n=1 Tax=Deinococcus rubellus TaxID=1889240 RepID=A0ABY5YJL6_9DEIO|nr:DNA methyltransferase [Deinococcus rubellus]UWX64287.1 DNA methyltransferase [Deinococcus rubellus]